MHLQNLKQGDLSVTQYLPKLNTEKNKCLLDVRSLSPIITSTSSRGFALNLRISLIVPLILVIVGVVADLIEGIVAEVVAPAIH